MLLLYNFGIALYRMIIYIASFFNLKAELFLNGRKNIFNVIEKQIDTKQKHVWFHFASLGEFEQGRTVLEELKKNYPQKKIVVTFFSPSGYEIRKNYAIADGVFYLPLDTKSNAKKLIDLIQPEIAIFTKYEFWYHYFQLLQERKIPLLIISGIFRPGQLFFKWYGGFYRSMLNCVTHFFVQNTESVELLQGLNFKNVSLSGDTRFDRVAENVLTVKHLPLIEEFCGKAPVFIAGSTWPQDEQLVTALIAAYPQWKFIIAPHEIGPAHIDQLLKLVPGALRYTQLNTKSPQPDSQVMVIDNIGLLSSIYQYGRVVYIGGGFGVSIHNTLEAAAFGLPVIFGPKYDKFQEAKDLLSLNAAITISSMAELSAAFKKLQKDTNAGPAAKKYVQDKTGATKQVLTYLEQYI
ncbi:3-deoxy-D-manno-octulosonic-acid transferase [Pedobacter cryoconitis]|uniref:3-deoxy-D-manno-octulosonic acid transferase n=1 Tax=Pedobacter cryoconitis TaxID=188932 RepID=UPI00160F293A|nr:glycosyltransferase N-terminal domain-containing protein [Pedobacter cryoconitis]MBB6274426.1 3-deoxy-D-manno-octulosonic-acid transferase [Pedobacter cryoconitis]